MARNARQALQATRNQMLLLLQDHMESLRRQPSLAIWNTAQTEIQQISEQCRQLIGYETHEDQRDVWHQIEVASLQLQTIEDEQRQQERGTRRHRETEERRPRPTKRLKAEEVPVFEGDLLKFALWRDTIDDLVMYNRDLDSSAKLRIIYGSLKGKALSRAGHYSRFDGSPKKLLKELDRYYADSEEIARECRELVRKAVPVSRIKPTEAWQGLYDVASGLRALPMDRSTKQRLIEEVKAKIPMACRHEFNQHYQPSVKELCRFLKTKLDSHRTEDLAEHREEPRKPDSSYDRRPNDWKRNNRPRSEGTVQIFLMEDGKCIFCKADHDSTVCTLSLDRRWEEIRKQDICGRCLKHKWSNSRRCSHFCPEATCKERNFRHHKLLCPSQQPEQVKVSVDKQVFLSTVLAKVSSGERSATVRVLLDSGARSSVISAAVARQLDCEIKGASRMVSGVGSAVSATKGKVKISLHPVTGQQAISLEAMVIDCITDIPTELPSAVLVDMLARKQIHLIDTTTPTSPSTSTISVIVGQDYRERFLTNTRMPLGPSFSAYYTLLGWMISGNTEEMDSASLSTRCVCSDLKLIFDFTEVEPEDVPLNITFNAHKKRYYVRLPYTDLDQLCNNRESAKAQAIRQKKQLTARGQLNDYHKIMLEYKDNDYAEKVPFPDRVVDPDSDLEDSNSDLTMGSSPKFHVPHSLVRKIETHLPGGDTKMKDRVVFNASASNGWGKSLNRCLYKGPVVNCDLFKCLLKMRAVPILLTTDLKKAFLQIRVRPHDRNLLRYFWYENLSDEEPTLYRMKVVLFGAVCSPGILGAVLEHHLHKYQEAYPTVVRELRTGTYVDDIGMGAKRPELARSLIISTTHLFEEASFRLHEWAVSDPEVVKITGKEYAVTCTDEFRNCLGILWNPKKDLLRLKIDAGSTLARPTKRSALGILSLMFDPMGWFLPVRVEMRLFAREMAMDGQEWDMPLRPEQAIRLEQFRLQFEPAARFDISRHVVTDTNTELHIYCDASPKALGAVAYLRTPSQSTSQVLLCSVGKLAPTKASTIPRLELCAAVMGVELMEKIVSKQVFELGSIFLYSDSQITLHRINNDHQKYQLYVARRINRIQTACKGKAQWAYVATKENPADLVTRGCNVSKLVEDDLWWNGCSPPKIVVQEFDGTDDELLHPVYFTQEESENTDLLQRPVAEARSQLQSEWEAMEDAQWSEVKAKRTMAVTKKIAAEAQLWRALQEHQFGREIRLLRQQVKLPKGSKLIPWNPFLDEWGVLRARRRLENAEVPYEVKYPIIVEDHIWMRQHIADLHERLNHPGANRTFEDLNQHFLMFRGKRICRSMIRNCQTCNKWRGKPFQAQPPPLPTFRVTEARPFAYMGLDYLGPITTYDGKRVYLLLATCAVTRAVELQVVVDLTMERCLMALERIFDKYGTPIEIHSDNASTFEKTNRVLTKVLRLLEVKAPERFSVRGLIRWIFQMPRAPWWGGFFERMVGTVKRTLDNTNIRKTFDYEEILTIVSNVQANVNSRPLTGSTMEEPALIPAHFTIGQSQTSIPPLPTSTVEQGDHLMELYLKRNRRYNALWNKWRKDYLMTLKHYWSDRSRVPEVGELVLISDEEAPRREWKTARIISLIPGTDGVVRGAEVKRCKPLPRERPILTRAIQSLIPLEAAPGKMSVNDRQGETEKV